MTDQLAFDDVCICQPGQRCTFCARKSQAILRMMRIARLMPRPYPPTVERADMVTSMCDARTLLSLACGFPVDAIHPARGTA